MDVRVGLWRKLSAKELIFVNCGVGELLRVPWTARRSNQFILKESSPGCSLEDLILKLQYFGHLMWRADSFEKILMLGKIKGRRREGNDRGWDGWMASLTQWTWVWVNSGSWWWTGRPGVLQSTGCKELDTTEQLNWLLERKSIFLYSYEKFYFLLGISSPSFCLLSYLLLVYRRCSGKESTCQCRKCKRRAFDH